MRAVRILISIALIADGLLELHALPIGFEFIGQDKRDRRADSRSHLRAMRDDENRPVRINSEIHAGIQHSVIDFRIFGESFRPQSFRQETHAEHQRSRRYHSLHESATAYVLNCAHAWLPSAAALMADRIRLKHPHRQIFPDMPSSISASVTFGLLLSSKAPSMICPHCHYPHSPPST